MVYIFFFFCSMKHRRLLSLPLLPTIAETLEDLPVHPSSSQSTQSSQCLEDYMTSIQALAHPVEVPTYGPFRLQKSPRLRQLSKAQMKLSVSVTRASPRTLRTSRLSGLNSHSSEDFSIKMSREQNCRGQDPVDWLFGQITAWRETVVCGKPCGYFGGGGKQGWRNLRRKHIVCVAEQRLNHENHENCKDLQYLLLMH